jgi:ABC-2 type transport system permease protein
MSGNSSFEMVSERGWRRGLGNLLSNEFSRWWKTRMWWVQCLIWGGIVGFLLGSVVLQTPDLPVSEMVMMYSLFGGLFPAIAVVIIMQDVLVGEKRSGTAAWVLSKPVSRPAFILSKFLAHALGVLVTMVIVPGVIAFLIFTFAAHVPIEVGRFLAAMGALFLSLVYYLTLALMLGSLFQGAGPVIAIALALIFGQQYLVSMIPFLKYVLPWTMLIAIPPDEGAIVPSILTGQPPWSWIPVLAIAVQIPAFLWIAVRRFRREEF